MSNTQRSFITLAVILFLGSVIGFNLFGNYMRAQYFATRPPPTFPVTVQKVGPMTWEPRLSAFGFIEPYQGVTLATQASGTIKNIAFESGQAVVKGQLLLALDSTVEEAKLEAQEALLPARERQMKRALKLFKDNSISENQKDDAVADYYSLKSEVAALKATINRRQLTAPFSGVIGLRNVYLGEYINAGHDIVQLEDISTMRIRFSIAQTDLSRIHVNQALEVQVDAYPEEAFRGNITAIEPAVNSQSGVVEIQADIPNDRQVLRSGMFARINVLLPEVPEQTIIPQSAIQFNLYGETLFIIDEFATKTMMDQKKQQQKKQQEQKPISNIAIVKQVSVQVKERAGHLAWIASGLKLNDRIVTSGQVRLSNGSQVRFVETDALAPMTPIPAL